MTKKQYKNLKVGDLITKTQGPNKGLIMKVIKKYSAFDGSLCLMAESIDEQKYVYNQNKCLRDGKHTYGVASCFKIL